MLASRGFVYRTAKDAEAGSHAHCQCLVCPGGPSTTIEGYDPDALYDLWQDRLKSTALTRAERRGTSYQIERMKIMDGYKAASRRARKRLR
jgi:hypothetical protein